MSTDVLSCRRARIDALADRIASLSATLDATTHAILVAIRQFDAEKGWALQGAKSCAHWLCWRTGCDPHTARERVRVAKALGELPQMDEALSRGEISYSKAREMTRVADSANEDLLLAQAKTATGSQLQRVCQGFASVKKTIERADDPEALDDRREVRRRNKRDGTVIIEARLLPDEAEAVMQALRMTRATLASTSDSAQMADENVPAGTPEPTLADALVALAERQMAQLEDEDEAAAEAEAPEPTPARAPKRRELLIHLRTSDIVQGAWTAELHDGTPLDGATFQRLACDSGLVVAHTDERGDPLDLSRRRRTVPPALMRALLLRDRHCRFPGCTSHAFVEAHHLEHWSRGGETNKDNLILLCPQHHVAMHEGGFTAEQTDEGLVFHEPGGRAVPLVPPPTEPEPFEPHPDPSVNLIDWDGSPADIHGGVGALIGRLLGVMH